MEIEHEDGRYTGIVDGAVATALEYRDDGRVRAMTRTVTNPQFRGKGYAALIVERAVADAEADGRLVSPVCWYVDKWFGQHPEKQALLA